MDRVLAIIFGLPVAILMLKYRKQLKDFIGEVSFAERIFGMGGTNTLIILLSIGVFILSLMYGMGTIQAFLQSTFGSLF